MKMACCDIFFDRMHEAYLEQGLIVKDAKKLRIHYVKNRSSTSESKISQITFINSSLIEEATCRFCQEQELLFILKITNYQIWKNWIFRRLTFVLDMISVLPTDLFFLYTGVACHEQVVILWSWLLIVWHRLTDQHIFGSELWLTEWLSEWQCQPWILLG